MTPREQEAFKKKQEAAQAVRPPRPERVTHERIPVGPRKPMGDMPHRYCEALEQDQKLNGCCRRMENLTGQYYKTSPDVSGPDLLIATCSCGRNHYRLMCATANL